MSAAHTRKKSLMNRTQSDNSLFLFFRKVSSIGVTYVGSQLILVYAFILWVSGKSLHKWKKVETIREAWNEKEFVKKGSDSYA